MSQHKAIPLEPDQVSQALEQLPGWKGDGHGLEKSITFKDFPSAIRFMQACVEGIDRRDHHPVWTNKYKTLDIHLDTFDAGHRVTAKDVELAGFIESVLDSLKQASIT